MGTSGRNRVAMWITQVPSAWNADAMAMRSSLDPSIAHRMISLGWAVSKRSFASATSASLSSVFRAGRLPSKGSRV